MVKNRAQVSPVAGWLLKLLINSKEVIKHLRKHRDIPDWKTCSQRTHMRLHDTEEYKEEGRIEAQNFCLPFFLFFSDTTGRNQIYTQGTK